MLKRLAHTDFSRMLRSLFRLKTFTKCDASYPLAAHGAGDLVIVQVPLEFGRHAGVSLLLPLWLPLTGPQEEKK